MSIDPQRLAELWAKGLNATQIATRLGASHSGVRQALRRIGVVDAGKKTDSRTNSSGSSV